MLFLLKCNVVLQVVVVEGSTTPFLGSYFRGGSFYSSGRLVRKVSELIFIPWHQSQTYPIIDSAFHSPYRVISVHMCSEGLHHHLGGRGSHSETSWIIWLFVYSDYLQSLAVQLSCSAAYHEGFLLRNYSPYWEASWRIALHFSTSWLKAKAPSINHCIIPTDV